MRSIGGILAVLFVVVIGLWLVGLILDIGGDSIHFLLLAAPVVAVFFILTSRRSTT